MSPWLSTVKSSPFAVSLLNLTWGRTAGGGCIFPSIPVVRWRQVSQLVWWAFYSTALPERPCQFRRSAAMLEDAPLPTSLSALWMSAVSRFGPSSWFCIDLYFFGHWQVVHQSFGLTRLSLSFCRLSGPAFYAFLHCLSTCFLEHLECAILLLFKSWLLFFPVNSLSVHSVCPIHL